MKNSINQNQENQSEQIKAKGYDRAILLIQNQVQLFWLIFGAFLLSETVLLGAITSINIDDSRNLIFWESIFGIILCFLWLTTSLYNHAFYILRINEAKIYEPDEGDFFSDGFKLYNGDEVHGVCIPKCVRFFRPKISLFILIGLFFFVFLMIGILNCPLIDKFC